MSEPSELATYAVGGGVAGKLLDLLARRLFKKEDTTDAALTALTKAVGELKALVDLAHQESQAAVARLTEKHAFLEGLQGKQTERIDGVAGDHNGRLHKLEDRLMRLETVVDERLPRRAD